MPRLGCRGVGCRGVTSNLKLPVKNQNSNSLNKHIFPKGFQFPFNGKMVACYLLVVHLQLLIQVWMEPFDKPCSTVLQHRINFDCCHAFSFRKKKKEKIIRQQFQPKCAYKLRAYKKWKVSKRVGYCFQNLETFGNIL